MPRPENAVDAANRPRTRQQAPIAGKRPQIRRTPKPGATDNRKSIDDPKFDRLLGGMEVEELASHLRQAGDLADRPGAGQRTEAAGAAPCLEPASPTQFRPSHSQTLISQSNCWRLKRIGECNEVSISID